MCNSFVSRFANSGQGPGVAGMFTAVLLPIVRVDAN
jgi:hypothetical protein